MTEPTETTPHHRHLEHAREQVIDLLSRKALELELVSRSGDRKQALVEQLVARKHPAALSQRLLSFHQDDIAFGFSSLSPEARRAGWPQGHSSARQTGGP